MNNYSKMNFYMPNDYAYLNGMTMQNVPAQNMKSGQMQNMQILQNQKQAQMMNEGSYPMPNQQKKQKVVQNMPDKKLQKKLAMQAGDNMNFNKCNYEQKIDPNNLYDVYGGFIRGNMFPDLFNQYKLDKPFDIEPMNEQAELLTYIDAYGFAAHDLNLYLDNNPDDRDMIKLFNEYTDQANKVMAEYESKYGPLFVDASNTYPWAWNKSPWPWENK